MIDYTITVGEIVFCQHLKYRSFVEALASRLSKLLNHCSSNLECYFVGGGSLQQPRAGRRHAFADGSGLDRARARVSGRTGTRTATVRTWVRDSTTRWQRTTLSQGEERHPDVGAHASQRRISVQLSDTKATTISVLYSRGSLQYLNSTSVRK